MVYIFQIYLKILASSARGSRHTRHALEILACSSYVACTKKTREAALGLLWGSLRLVDMGFTVSVGVGVGLGRDL